MFRECLRAHLVSWFPWIQTPGVYDAQIQSSFWTAEEVGLLPQLRGLVVVLFKLFVVPAQGTDGRNKSLWDKMLCQAI